jgi:hypothetical protein
MVKINTGTCYIGESWEPQIGTRDDIPELNKETDSFSIIFTRPD